MHNTRVKRIDLMVLGLFVALTAFGAAAYGEIVFGEPTLIPVDGVTDVSYPHVSHDGLELCFSSAKSGGCPDIWVMRRPTADAEWGAPVKLDAPVNTPGPEVAPCLSPDGLELYFSDEDLGDLGCRQRQRPGGFGKADIWVSRRASKDAPWGEPENLGSTINTPEDEDAPSLSADGLSMYFMSSLRPDGHGTYDLYVSTRPSTNDPWGPPQNLGPPINTSGAEVTPILSADGLSLFFTELFEEAVYVSRRSSLSDPWSTPTLFEPIALPGLEFFVNFCDEDSTFYFQNAARFQDPGSLWKMEATPLVDFNGDGKVNGIEVRSLAEHWGEASSFYDIAPVPFGDNVVDVQDLLILAEYVGEDFVDPTLVAHWAFDETEGDIAHDSAGQNDATITGTVAWQPDSGWIDGALEFDGTTSLAAGFVLDPSNGPFSVFAWIKGGAAGQVIMSQVDGLNWLMIDASSSTLATSLGRAGRNPAPPLVSNTVIVNDAWHRIGLVWDGTSRALYVDNALAAEDVQGPLAGCSGDMHIGCGKDRVSGTFFSGLIDDVRIYNRAVKP